MTIYLDCDDVLADYRSGACKLFEVNRDQLIKEWEVGRWDKDYDIRMPLSKCLGLEKPLEPLAFWRHFNYNREFWATLVPLPWAKELLEYVNTVATEWAIVTSPVPYSDVLGCTASHLGKYEWLKHNFNIDCYKVIVTPHKHWLAKEGTILIDDCMGNVANFVRHGGDGVIFPRHHNVYHKQEHDPVGSVKEVLNTLRS